MRFFSTQGRIGRKHYFLHSFLSVFGPILAMLVILDPGRWFGGSSGLTAESLACFFVIVLINAAGEFCSTIRRLHDLDRPGAHIFLLAIPIYNVYLNCVLLFRRGTNGPNRYGEDPRVAYTLSYETT